MNKTAMVIAGLFIGVLIAGAVVFGAGNFQKKAEVKITPTLTPTPIIEKTVWDDQSGFTFEYPKNLTLDPHDEDKINYAHVELTSVGHPGKIIVWTKDTKAEDLETYLKLNKITSVIDTSLGGMDAKKMITGDEEKTIKIAAIKDGFLYEIELYPQDEIYWNTIFDNLLASYKFKEIEEKTVESAPKDNTVESDFVEEETIE